MIPREKCLEWAKEYGLCTDIAVYRGVWQDAALQALIDRAYAEGQREMRERAADAIEGQRYMYDALYAVKNLEIK